MTRDARPESHAVLARETVQKDGSRRVALRVFCTQRSESVDFDVCRQCEKLIDIESDLTGCAWIRCGAKDEVAATAEATSVGSVLETGALCVEDDVPIASVAAILSERKMPELHVVNAGGLLLGTVRDVDLLKMRLESRLNALAATLMSSALKVRERAGLHDVLIALASAHARRVAVVAHDGILVSALGDIALLERWNQLRRKSR